MIQDDRRPGVVVCTITSLLQVTIEAVDKIIVIKILSGQEDELLPVLVDDFWV
jgi:hypothetical protein